MNQEGMAPEPSEGREIEERETTAGQLTDEERFTEPEWLEWFALTPQQRWAESEKLWVHYLEIGGRLDPEPDTQSPFFDPQEWRENFGHGRTGVRVLRRRGV